MRRDPMRQSERTISPALFPNSNAALLMGTGRVPHGKGWGKPARPLLFVFLYGTWAWRHHAR